MNKILIMRNVWYDIFLSNQIVSPHLLKLNHMPNVIKLYILLSEM